MPERGMVYEKSIFKGRRRHTDFGFRAVRLLFKSYTEDGSEGNAEVQ